MDQSLKKKSFKFGWFDLRVKSKKKSVHCGISFHSNLTKSQLPDVNIPVVKTNSNASKLSSTAADCTSRSQPDNTGTRKNSFLDFLLKKKKRKNRKEKKKRRKNLKMHVIISKTT